MRGSFTLKESAKRSYWQTTIEGRKRENNKKEWKTVQTERETL